MLTHDRLIQVLVYDSETGEFRWRIRPSNRVKVGDVAGRVDGNGYRGIRVDGVLYYAHRLAFFYMTGEWPSYNIDHDNRCRDDNRWGNIDDKTQAQNLQNLGLAPSNTSGYRGVYYHSAARKWSAERTIEGVKHYMGLFPTPEAARDAWVEFSTERGLRV